MIGSESEMSVSHSEDEKDEESNGKSENYEVSTDEQKGFVSNPLH